MAILDTLITQLGPAGLAGLAQQPRHTVRTTGAPPGQTSEEEAEGLRAFRQEAMGALALFTGGRSLAGLRGGGPQAGDMQAALSSRLGGLPNGLTGLQQASQTLAAPAPTLPASAPLPPSPPGSPTGGTEANPPAGGATMRAAAGNPPNGNSPSPFGTALPDWAALLARANRTTRQALREVEPTLNNAEQAMARFTRQEAAQPASTSLRAPSAGHPASPATSLLDLASLMTARSILALHVPAGRQVRQNTAPGNRATPATRLRQPPGMTGTPPPTPMPDTPPAGAAILSGYGTDNPAQAPQAAPMARIRQARAGVPSHPAHGSGGADGGAATRLGQLAHALAQASRTMGRGLPAQGRKTGQPMGWAERPEGMASPPPLLARLAGGIDTTARPRHVTTHNNTTHSPNIHISVEAGHGRVEDIVRAVEHSTIKALTRHMLGQTA